MTALDPDPAVGRGLVRAHRNRRAWTASHHVRACLDNRVATMSRVGEDSRASLRFQRDGRATSPMYKLLLAATYDDVERDGPCAEVLAQAPADVDPIFEAMPLRFLGGVHRIVLDGRAPDLAVCYPSAGGTFDPDEPGDVGGALSPDRRRTPRRACGVTDARCADQRSRSMRGVARSASWLSRARRGCRLRVLELGASAGLNLRWDRYRYEGGADGEAWGDPLSPLRFEGVYVDPLPHLDIDAVVVERAGCDRGPIDATTADGALTLRSFVWPDQPERIAALDAALALGAIGSGHRRAGRCRRLGRGATRGTPVRRGDGRVPLDRVAVPVDRDTRARVQHAIERAGAIATADAPMAWVRMEPGRDPTKSAEVRISRWPDGPERVLARTGYHGRPVRPVPAHAAPVSTDAARPTSP